MRYLLITAFLLAGLLPASIQAQQECLKDCSCSIKGKIVNGENERPIPYASIQIKNSSKGVLSDENGNFVIAGLCEPEFDLLISHVGYKSLVHHHDIYHPELVVKMAANNLILESIVVEGEAVATGIESLTETKLSGKDLELLKNQSFGNVLANIPGVTTLKTGQNIVKPVIHGLHSNRILIINNGIRHEGQQWGAGHAPEIDPSLAENISVVKGAATVKYGPDAMGGAVIMNPPKMELSTGHLHGEAGLVGKSNGRSAGGDLLLQRGYKKFAWKAQASGLYQGDLKAPDYYLTNTGARETSYALGARYHLGQLDLTVDYTHIQQQLGILRGSVVGNLDDLDAALKAEEPYFTRPFSYEISSPYQGTSHDLTRFKASYNWKNNLLEFQYGFQTNRRKEYDVRRGSNNETPSIDLELLTHTVDIDWQHQKWKGWTGTIGGQWLYQDNNNLPGTNTIPFVPNYNNYRVGLYIIEQRSMSSGNYEFGLRYDYQNSSIRGRDSFNKIYSHDLRYQSLSGLMGINIPTGPKTSFKSHVGTAWRPPNIAELYSYGKHDFVATYGLWRHDYTESSTEVYDQHTRPIENELGFKWVNTFSHSTENKNSLEITAYIHWIRNYIFSKPGGITSTIRGPLPFYIYDQTDALFMGMDASYILKHSEHWQSHLKGSYLHVRDVDNDDVLNGIAPGRLSYDISYSGSVLGLKNFEAKLSGIYTFEQYRAPRVIPVGELKSREEGSLFIDNGRSFDFVAAPKGYFLFNAAANITYDPFIFGVQIKNMLNTTYRDYTNLLRYFSDAPGRNIVVSIRYKF